MQSAAINYIGAQTTENRTQFATLTRFNFDGKHQRSTHPNFESKHRAMEGNKEKIFEV